jgi:cell division protein FtsW (lipid II flippase)
MTFADPNRVLVYTVLLAVGTLGAISDAMLNQWARTGRTSWLMVAYASWIVVATLLGYILRLNYFTFGAAVVLFLMVNSVAALILDHALFAGRLTARGWLGIGLAVAAIICIESSRPHGPSAGPTTVLRDRRTPDNTHSGVSRDQEPE